MKKRLANILCLVLALTTLLTSGALAASPDVVEPAVTVRVNGDIVDFPDGQPYIDDNGRTMIPVRFVTEQLGAKVSWDGETQTAVVEKDNIRVDIPIGKSNLTVTQNGKAAAVVMDTTAVLRDGRTYIPIRYVAEALGAYVDYSEVYKTVGIYLDEFTADEINTLRSYAYTKPQGATGYEEAKNSWLANRIDFYYGDGKIRESFGNFANAHEHLYHTLPRIAKYGFAGIKTIMENGTGEVFYANVVREAIAEISYESERLTVNFRADNSCIYQSDSMNSITTCVRGIADVLLNVKPTELTGVETLLLCKLGYSQLYEGDNVSNPVDIHMNTSASYAVDIHTIVPLAEVK